MMDYSTWRELATAFVRVSAAADGWSVESVKVAKTATAYVRLRHRSGCLAVVRLSDHRPRRGYGDRLLSIRQRATGRLRMLGTFLARCVGAGPVVG